MISTHPFLIFFVIIVFGTIISYSTIYIVLSGRVKNLERELLDLFIKKTSKIPALIEVMRPYIDKSESFNPIIRVHTEVMIEELQSIYDILSHNAQIQSNFLFLMQLSVHVPGLQKDEYFLYIRDFIIDYEKRMKSDFDLIHTAIERWNKFIRIKNRTLIGYLLPGQYQQELR